MLEDGQVTGLKDNAADGLGRYVSVVSFSTGSSVACEWMDVSTADGYNAVKAAIDGLKTGGGTNFEQGLSKAKSQLDNTTVKDIASKNVIALTDGEPTYWGTNNYGGGNGKKCSETVYTKTKAAATNLKKTGAKLYTICFGAANEKIKEYDDGKYIHGTITVGDFLKNKIATLAAGGKTYAYNATNTTELMKAFKAITSSITEGIKTGTVLDPMGDHITVTSKPDNFVETPTGYKWELSNPTVATDGGKTTYTYELTYTVTFDPNFGDFDENSYYAANKETTFTAGGEVYNFNVPGVKGTAPKYNVTYEYAGTVPTGAPELPDEASYKAGATVKVAAAPTLAGYTFSGWTTSDAAVSSDGSFTMPSKDVKLTGSWTLRSDLSYTVHYYWNGTETKVAEDKTVDSQTFNETVTETPVPVNGYTPVSDATVELTIGTDTNANVITFYYYKNVELKANGDTVTYDGKVHSVSGFTGAPEGADFSTIKVGAKGTEAGTYPANFAEGTVGTVDATGKYIVTETTNGELIINPAYQITYQYSNAPENAPTCPVDNAYYADGTTVSPLENPGTLEGYIFSGWKINGEGDAVTGVTFDGANIKLIGEWKPVTGLTCTINYIWNGNKTTPIRTDTIDGLTYNEVVTKFPMEIPGYTPVSNNSQEIIVETTGNIINFYYYKNVTLESNSGKFTYNGKDHSVSGYDVITKADNGKDVKVDAEFIGVSASRTEKDVGSYPVTFKFKGNLVDKEGLIGKIDSNLYYIVSDVKEGTLTIEKIKDEVTVKITGNTKTVTYNGKEHNVTGYATDVGDKPITVALNDGKVAEAKGTDVGTYYMQLTAADFVVTSDIYANIKVIVEDGWLKINRRPMPPVNPPITDKITVEITGNSDSVVYDGTEHSVKDYTVKISDSRYTEKDFTFSGKALASGVNAGTHEMGLKADQFKNANARFKNVEFIIKADGVLTITQRPLTITAGSAEGIAPVTCDKYTVEGLATGDKVDSVKITGIQSEPGESPNVASDAVIKNAKGEDVTANYKITYVNGVLKAIEVLNKEIHFNYVIGYTDGTIRPNNDISRAEVATIFFRLLTDEAREQYTTTAGNFTDVKAGMWCNRAIATLTNMGIIKGYTDGSFQPNKSITRAELATIIARFAKLDVNTKTFSDINGHWAQKNIELAAGNGWINGYEDGTFRPNNNITRAETFAMINRVLDRQTESVSDLLPTSEMNMWSDNLNENAWYYKDVQEATNYHKCDRVGDSVYEKWTEKVPDIDWASYQI